MGNLFKNYDGDISDIQDTIEDIKSNVIKSVTVAQDGKLVITSYSGKPTQIDVKGTPGPAGIQGPSGPPGPAGPSGPSNVDVANLAGVKFTREWSGYPDKIDGNIWGSEISNDTNGFKKLMIIGNKSEDGVKRKVGIWDELEVNGDLNVKGIIKKNGSEIGQKGDKGDKGDRGADGGASPWNGPYVVRFYDKTDKKCLDAGQITPGKNGDLDCQAGNKYQQWYVNSTTGQLKNVQSGQCLDRNDNNIWGLNACNDHHNQQFWRKEHILQWKNGNCLDIGNANRNASCDGNNKNQKFRFETNLNAGVNYY